VNAHGLVNALLEAPGADDFDLDQYAAGALNRQSWEAPNPEKHLWIEALKPLGFQAYQGKYKDHGQIIRYWAAAKELKMVSGQDLSLVASAYKDGNVGLTIYHQQHNGRTPLGVWTSRPLTLAELPQATRTIIDRAQKAEVYIGFSSTYDERDALQQALGEYSLIYPLA